MTEYTFRVEVMHGQDQREVNADKFNEEEAIAAWNTRAPDPRLAEVEAEREGHPFERLRKIIHDDLEYAWAWQCNLAVPIMDATPCTHAQANEAAALIMAQMFGYDITDHSEYTAGKSPAQEYFEMRVDAEKEEFRAALGAKP